jgi:cytochrome bd-type quinol oxidase subunit 1
MDWFKDRALEILAMVVAVFGAWFGLKAGVDRALRQGRQLSHSFALLENSLDEHVKESQASRLDVMQLQTKMEALESEVEKNRARLHDLASGVTTVRLMVDQLRK